MVDICSLTILYTEQLPQHDYIQLKLSDQKIRTFQLMIDVWFVGIYLNKWFPSKFKFDFLLNNKKALRFCCKCLFFKKCDRNYKKPFIIQYTLKKSVCRHCQHHHINISSQSLLKYLKCVTVKLLQKKKKSRQNFCSRLFSGLQLSNPIATFIVYIYTSY